MPKFEIKTHSTFENVYLIEADTLEQAIHMLHNNMEPPDFMQKHLWEDLYELSTENDLSYSDWFSKQKKLGYD